MRLRLVLLISALILRGCTTLMKVDTTGGVTAHTWPTPSRSRWWPDMLHSPGATAGSGPATRRCGPPPSAGAAPRSRPWPERVVRSRWSSPPAAVTHRANAPRSAAAAHRCCTRVVGAAACARTAAAPSRSWLAAGCTTTLSMAPGVPGGSTSSCRLRPVTRGPPAPPRGPLLRSS